MKNLSQPSFFRVLDLLVSLTNPGLKRSRWTHDGVDLQRERHTFTGPKHGLAIDVFTVTQTDRRGWSLIVGKEYWWLGEDGKTMRSFHWVRHTNGQRGDILAWFRAQEAKTNRPPLLKEESDAHPKPTSVKSVGAE
jgi:hypothetical protein